MRNRTHNLVNSRQIVTVRLSLDTKASGEKSGKEYASALQCVDRQRKTVTQTQDNRQCNVKANIHVCHYHYVFDNTHIAQSRREAYEPDTGNRIDILQAVKASDLILIRTRDGESLPVAHAC